jgi:cytoskeletal protein RodZ
MGREAFSMKEDISVLGLATIRRNRGISLEQIAESTKISIRSLAAIEQGDFKKLPGGIYNTSYIRQYARAIDYDESAILSYYHSAMGTTESVSSGDGTNGRRFVNGYRPASSILGS